MWLLILIIQLYVSKLLSVSHPRGLKAALIDADKFNGKVTTNHFGINLLPSTVLQHVIKFLAMNTKPTRVSKAFKQAALESISGVEWFDMMTSYFDATFMMKSEMEDWILSTWSTFDDARKNHLGSDSRFYFASVSTNVDDWGPVLDNIYFPFDEHAIQRTSLLLYHTSCSWTEQVILNAIILSLFNESEFNRNAHEAVAHVFNVVHLIGCLDEMKRLCFKYSNITFGAALFQNILENLHSDLSWEWYGLMADKSRRDPTEWLTSESLARMTEFWIGWLKYTNFGWNVISTETENQLARVWNKRRLPEACRLLLVFHHHQYIHGEPDMLYNGKIYLSKWDI